MNRASVEAARDNRLLQSPILQSFSHYLCLRLSSRVFRLCDTQQLVILLVGRHQYKTINLPESSKISEELPVEVYLPNLVREVLLHLCSTRLPCCSSTPHSSRPAQGDFVHVASRVVYHTCGQCCQLHVGDAHTICQRTHLLDNVLGNMDRAAVGEESACSLGKKDTAKVCRGLEG